MTKSQLTSKSGGEVYQIEYKDFTTFPALVRGSNNHVQIPKVVKIKTSTNDSAQIKFRERRYNIPIPEKKLKLLIPPDAKRVIFEPTKNN